MKNKKIVSLSLCIAALSVLFVAAMVVRSLNTTISATEKDGVETFSDPDPSSYFSWKTAWQNNNQISQRMESTFDKIEGEYNYDIAKSVFVDTLEGDTKPRFTAMSDTFYLSTTLIENPQVGDWPQFEAVKPTHEYEVTNYDYWKNMPSNSEGKFSSTTNNWPGVAHWASWPAPDVMSSAYVMSVNDTPMTYTFSGDVPSGPKYTLHTQVRIGQYSPPASGRNDKGWAIGHDIAVPQLVKAIFKDVDDPEGPSLSEDDILGMHGEMGNSVTANSKTIQGYDFVSSQIILGPTLRISIPDKVGETSILFPENFSYNDNTSSVKDPTSDDNWSTTLDSQQKGIVFWYKKKTPNISLSKQVDKAEAFVGDKLMYTINGTNNGDADLVNAKIVDKMPQGMSKPENVKLDDQILPENQGVDGKYYTWNSTTNELEIFAGDIGINETKVITYETSATSGTPGEQKINTATLSGDNSIQNPTGEATVTILKEKQYISLSIDNVLATTGDNDISFVADVTASTKNTDLTNATLTINYPQDNLLLGTMKIIQDDKDITSGTTIDTTKKNTITITSINAKDIQNYPIKVVFSQTEALIELDETTYSGEVFTEDVDIEKASTQYTVEIKKGDLKLLWVPDVLDFKGHNLEEIIEANKNEFESTNIPTYTVVSDTRSKNITNSWRVSVSTSNMNKVNSDEKITDLSYLLGGNELKEYTSSDNSIPPNEENTTSPPASWKDFITVASDTTIINEPGFTSDILSAKTGVENGKYALKVNQAKLKINDLARITEGDYGGSISWTLIDGL